MLTPALDALLAAHRDLEAEARSLAAATAGGARLPPRRSRRLARALLAQQRVEEAVVLPALASADPTFDPAPVLADHAEVATAARALRTATDPAASAVRLARLVELHHADEEAAVVPRWAALTPATDRAIARRLRRTRRP